MEYLFAWFDSSLPARLLGIAVFSAVAHGLVLLVRRASLLVKASDRAVQPKVRTIVGLVSSALVFAIYFGAVGLALREFGVDLTVYLASASVIGLAVGFGSQGVVQDVVTGVTFIFTDLIDVGDLVEISGQTGQVRAITMRFVELENALGARVFIPNRTIANVVNYPKGYVRLLVDITLRGGDTMQAAMAEAAQRLMESVQDQYPGLLLTDPSVQGQMTTRHGKAFLRLKFRIWPNRGDVIDQVMKKELVAQLKAMDPDYEDWMINITWESEARTWRRRPR